MWQWCVCVCVCVWRGRCVARVWEVWGVRSGLVLWRECGLRCCVACVWGRLVCRVCGGCVACATCGGWAVGRVGGWLGGWVGGWMGGLMVCGVACGWCCGVVVCGLGWRCGVSAA